MAGAGRQHLADTGMSYGEHRRRAWRIGGALAVAGGACFIHGLFPSIFTDKATRTIVHLNEELKSAHADKAEPVLLEFEI